MGRVLITASDEPRKELDDLESVARVDFGGVYFFFYDALRELAESTGQMIDPRKNAFFQGERLVELERWLAANFEGAVIQPSEWGQQVGTQANGEVIYQRTTRNDVIAFLRSIARAARMAQERNEGVLFLGE